MQPNATIDPSGEKDPNGRLRIAVWSPFGPLKQQLRELIARAHDLDTIELAATPLPSAVRDSGAIVFVVDVDGAPDGAGALIRDVLRAAPDVTVVAVSTHADRRLAECALRSGAAGYVLKDRAFEELADAVRAARRNQRYVSPAIDRSI
jgi:DNA-binding NarL/FixJ family response regulator